MKFLPLIWKNLWRRKFRTIFTLLSIFVAFLLFGLLMTIRDGVQRSASTSPALDRLVLIHKVSLIMPLPVSYQARLQRCQASSWPRTRPGSAASIRIRRTSSRKWRSSRSRS